MKVPWCIPNFHPDDIQHMKQVLDSGWLSMGPEVERFEKNMTDYTQMKHAIAVNNGTSAVDLALKTLGIQEGDEVIIPAMTYIATANAVRYNHATPVYVDVDTSLNINTELIEQYITPHTKAIMNIDYGGNPADYTRLQQISHGHDIPLVTDGAQSLGSEYKGKQCLSYGVINATSFHQAKIMTTIEGGMVFTNDKQLAYRARCIRNQGQTQRYVHTHLGNNYRMIDVVAAMGNSQIHRLKETLRDRRQKAHYYKDHLSNVGYPMERRQGLNSYFFFNIIVKQRDMLQRYLLKHGVETRNSITLVDTTYAKGISSQLLALPLYNKLSLEEQDYVIRTVNDFQRTH